LIKIYSPREGIKIANQKTVGMQENSKQSGGMDSV
jgi:hypothetical protein